MICFDLFFSPALSRLTSLTITAEKNCPHHLLKRARGLRGAKLCDL